jgi:acyl-CoA dehydrogenase
MGFELQGNRSGYSDAQLELVDSLHPLLDKHCPRSRIRGLIEDNNSVAPDSVWTQLVEAGWTSLLYPEEAGGKGLGMAEMSAVLVEAGRFLLPGPFFTSAVLTPLALAATREGSAADLPGIGGVASGQRVAALALYEDPSVFPMPKIAATVQNGHISGVKRFVLDAAMADVLVVLAKDGSGDLVLAWVAAPAPGINVLVHPTMDGRRVCTVTLDKAVVAKTLPVSGAGLQQLMLRAAVLVASLQIGGAETALALAVEFAQTRVQFGRPIGAFQAISHRLVDLYCNLAVGRALVQKAIRLADADGFPDAASRAKIWMNDTYRAVTKGALQTFGGIGFTFDHDIHLFLRSAYALGSEFGTSADHQRLLRPAARAA